MNLKLILFFSLFVNLNVAECQVVFKPLLSSGEIPTDFTLTPYNKVLLNDKSTNVIQLNKTERKTIQRFNLETNYINDFLYRSGRLSINTEVDLYLNQIAAYLLRNNDKLRASINIYTLKSAEYNASAAHNGNIYINIGLLAKIENEAQLAFIIAHEIMHYVHNDNLEGYIEEYKIDNNKDEYKKISYDEALLKKSTYSKTQEFRADSAALIKLFIKTDYSLNAINEGFKNILYSYHNCNRNNKTFCLKENLGINIPDSLLLQEVEPIVFNENYNDSLSTHPNIHSRVERVKKLIDKRPSGNKQYIVSKESFAHMQKIATTELLHINIQQQQYEDAICNSLLLPDYKKNDTISQLSNGIALMQLAYYKYNNDFDAIHKIYKDVRGEAQQVYYLFEKLDKKEMAFLSLIYNYKIKYKHGDIANINSTISKCVSLIAMDLNMSLEDIISYSIEENTFLSNELNTLLNYRYFKEQFSYYKKQKEADLALKEELISNKAKREAILKEAKINKKKGFALGIDTLVVINPIYYNSEGSRHALKRSDQKRFKLINSLNLNAKKIGLELTILDLKLFDENDMDKYNDYCLLSNWFSEKCSHSSDNYFMYNSLYTDYLINKYNTKYYAWMGLIDNKALNFYVFDIETSKIVLSQRERIMGLECSTEINQALKRILSQVKTERK